MGVSVLQMLNEASDEQGITEVASRYLADQASDSPISGAAEGQGAAAENVVSEEPAQMGSTDTGAGTKVAPDISEGNRIKNESNIWRMYFKLMLANIVQERDASGITFTIDVGFALHVTEAMISGFVETYFATQRDDYEFGKEEEDEARILRRAATTAMRVTAIVTKMTYLAEVAALDNPFGRLTKAHYPTFLPFWDETALAGSSRRRSSFQRRARIWPRCEHCFPGQSWIIMRWRGRD